MNKMKEISHFTVPTNDRSIAEGDDSIQSQPIHATTTNSDLVEDRNSIPSGPSKEEQTLRQSEEEEEEEEEALHDQARRHRFCEGDHCFTIDNDSKFRPSWSALSYATNRDVEDVTGSQCSYHSCMGVYECPVDECKVVANSANPRTKRTKHRQPDGACGDGMCHVHKEELVHRPCDAFWKCYSFPPNNVHPNGYTKIEHKGDHDHARPHEKLSKNARAAFVEHVQSNVGLFPTQLKMGFN